MEIRLHLLDSFAARGSDGNNYKVCAYERLMLVPANTEQWEPTGQSEYRLDDGRHVEIDKEGTMRIAGTDVVLKQSATESADRSRG